MRSWRANVRLRMRLVGTGMTTDDPIRVDLPTYTMLRVDYVNRLALVDVPDVDCPQLSAAQRQAQTMDYLAPVDDVLGGRDLVTVPVGRTLPAPTGLTLAAKAKGDWHARIDAHYREHAGRFRPEIG